MLQSWRTMLSFRDVKVNRDEVRPQRCRTDTWKAELWRIIAVRLHVSQFSKAPTHAQGRATKMA